MIGALVLNGDKYLGEILGDMVVCCDGGYNKSPRADLFVGDRDSVVGEITCPMIELNARKDMTDGEAGLDYLIDKGASEVIIYGLDGGRLDHQLMNIALMGRAVRAGVKCSAICNTFTAYMVDDIFKQKLDIGTVVSVAPFCDDLHISYTKGLGYPLTDYKVDKFSTLTISNEVVSCDVEIAVRGYALIIVNGANIA